MKIDMNSTKFLDNATDVKHKDVVTIASEGKWQESNRFKKEDGTPTNEFRVNLKLANGDIRNTTLNWTNVKMLVSGFGDETANWVGKEVKAWKTASERAKAGYTFLFAPLTWERDETGIWTKDGQAPGDNQDVENLDPADIPF